MVPSTVTTARIIAFIEGGLGALFGILFLIGGGLAASSGSGALGGAVGGVAIVIAVIILAVAALYIVSAIALGKLSNWARWTLVVIGALQILGGLSSLSRGGITGIISLVLGGLMVYLLAFAAASRQAFDAAGSPRYIPPGYGGPPPS